ncbi:hypothetical protein MRX96_029666 [Rhipicephalus microplus]
MSSCRQSPLSRVSEPRSEQARGCSRLTAARSRDGIVNRRVGLGRPIALAIRLSTHIHTIIAAATEASHLAPSERERGSVPDGSRSRLHSVSCSASPWLLQHAANAVAGQWRQFTSLAGLLLPWIRLAALYLESTRGHSATPFHPLGARTSCTSNCISGSLTADVSSTHGSLSCEFLEMRRILLLDPTDEYPELVV